MLREREREGEGEREREGEGVHIMECTRAGPALRGPWPLLQLSSEPSMNAPLFSLQCNNSSICAGLGTRSKTPS